MGGLAPQRATETRSCPQHVPVAVFDAGAIFSIRADDPYIRAAKGVQLVRHTEPTVYRGCTAAIIALTHVRSAAAFVAPCRARGWPVVAVTSRAVNRQKSGLVEALKGVQTKMSGAFSSRPSEALLRSGDDLQ